jgi:hypothetical protein
MSRVFRRTASGSAILTRPNSGLTSFERALLTMIDGKRTASDLRKLLAAFGNVNALLRELFDDRLIEIDEAYSNKLAATRNEIAQENAAFRSNLGATTTATIGRGVSFPTTTRDLRDALLPEPALPPVPTAVDRARAALQLDLYADEARTPAISAMAILKSKEYAKRYVFDAIGASGTALCLSIDRAEDVKELQWATQVASKALHELKSAAVGKEFDQRLREIWLED